MYLNRYFLVPTAFFALAVGLVATFSLDTWLADWLFQLEGRMWILKDNWLTQDLLHEGGREVSVVLALALLLLIGCSYYFDALKPYRSGMWYVFLSAIIATLMVSVLKSVTHRDCPWDLLRYGGFKPEIPLFSASPGNFEYGKCFPAGHASAGYCWFGVYFFAREHIRDWRLPGLLFPLVLGLLFGIDQQLRGAHFLSHDIWSAWICWSTAALLGYLFFQRKASLEQITLSLP